MLKSTMKLNSGSVGTRAMAGSHPPAWMQDKEGWCACQMLLSLCQHTHLAGENSLAQITYGFPNATQPI